MIRWMLLFGCLGCDEAAGPPDLSATSDLSINSDLGGSAIGGPCQGDQDCHQGTSPVCWKKTYLNRPGNLATPGGYCSSACNDDSDCGDAACIDEGSGGKWCMAPCLAATDCRSGFACFTFSTDHCFPSGNLTCDPTAGDGTCKGAGSLPGGCARYALGTGKTGYCYDGCTAGAGSCPPVGGIARQCTVLIYAGDSLGDKFKGPVCVGQYSMNAIGDECVSGASDFVDACVDGAACHLVRQGGDNLCHAMCVEGATDGGAACSSGTCTDVWDLFGGSNPVGLCK